MSEDLTPRQPDKLDRLIGLVEALTADVSEMKAQFSEMKAQFNAFENRLVAIEERLAPTNQLPKIYAEVLEISTKLGKLDRAHMSVVELLGDLSGRSLDLDRRVRELEKK